MSDNKWWGLRRQLPPRAQLRAISALDVPPHRRVVELLRAHGLPHGRRARRRFYGQLRQWIDHVPRSAYDVWFAPFTVLFAVAALVETPAWFARWLLYERPWRAPEKWLGVVDG